MNERCATIMCSFISCKQARVIDSWDIYESIWVCKHENRLKSRHRYFLLSPKLTDPKLLNGKYFYTILYYKTHTHTKTVPNHHLLKLSCKNGLFRTSNNLRHQTHEYINTQRLYLHVNGIKQSENGWKIII